MKKHLILGIMALATIVSCTKSEVLNQETLNEKAISFSTYVGKAKQTKATTILESNVAEAGIGVMAWRTGEENASDAFLLANKPSFMPNIPLIWDGSIAVYKPERYWPSTGAKVSFYAYAPYSKGDGSETGNIYHPENITFPLVGGNPDIGAHKLSLKVPRGDDDVKVSKEGFTLDETNESTYILVNNGVEYGNQTDFMVARVGNTTEAGNNQNLTKDYNDKVNLNMRHALSKISLEACAGTGNNGQTEPYSDGNVKVVFDYIKINGEFISKGEYNLFNQTWTLDKSNNRVTSYSFVNAEGSDPTKDPFNPIADEVYNLQSQDGAEANETNTPDAAGWYKLNRSSHDLMVIPIVDQDNNATPVTYTPAQIESIDVKYIVKTFELKNIGSPEEPNNVMVENEDYRDDVYFTETFDEPLKLEAGKHYKFRFNIKLKKIEFDVDIEPWDENNVYNVVDTDASSSNQGGTQGGGTPGTGGGSGSGE